MLISIMIPTYNQKEYICEAINTALSQTYENIEVIVCDDNSTDNTYELIKSIKNKKLKIFKNCSNLGRIKNYQKLLYELAIGDYVLNLDGDDYLNDKNYIKNAVDLIHKYNLDLVFSNQYIDYSTHIKKTDMKLNNCIDGNWLFLNYGKDGIHIPHATAIYNRKKAMELNFYSQNIISTDWESILKLLINNKIGFIDTASCSWRQIDNSQSKTTDINLIFDNFKLIDRVLIYANNYFEKKDLLIWKNRMYSNFIKDISTKNMSCNFIKILIFSSKKLSKAYFFKLLLNYRFIGKVFIGRIQQLCVE